MSQGDQLNVAITVEDGSEEAVSGVPVTKEEVLKNFSDLPNPVFSVLDSCSEWKAWVLCDRDPVDHWSDGTSPVVLLSDAAHPMLQYAAQGAAQCFEDALALDYSLRTSHCGELSRERVFDAIQLYEQLRIPRSSQVVRDARRIGRLVYHTENESAAERNDVLQALGVGGLQEFVVRYHDPNSVVPRRTAFECRAAQPPKNSSD